MSPHVACPCVPVCAESGPFALKPHETRMSPPCHAVYSPYGHAGPSACGISLPLAGRAAGHLSSSSHSCAVAGGWDGLYAMYMQSYARTINPNPRCNHTDMQSPPPPMQPYVHAQACCIASITLLRWLLIAATWPLSSCRPRLFHSCSILQLRVIRSSVGSSGF